MQRFFLSVFLPEWWFVGYWRLQYLLASCLHVVSLKRLVKGKQKTADWSLRSPWRPAVEPPSPDFSIPCCRWHLPCWCLSRVFSTRVAPAREVEEKEPTVQLLQQPTVTTHRHFLWPLLSHFGIKREAAMCPWIRHFDPGEWVLQVEANTLQAKVKSLLYQAWSCSQLLLQTCSGSVKIIELSHVKMLYSSKSCFV